MSVITRKIIKVDAQNPTSNKTTVSQDEINHSSSFRSAVGSAGNTALDQNMSNNQQSNTGNDNNKWLIGVFFLIIILIVVLGFIVIKVFKIQVFKTSNTNSSPKTLDVAKNPSNSVPPENQVFTIKDPATKEAFDNAKKILAQVDLNNPALENSGILYAYTGTIIELQKNANGISSFVTDTIITGLPNTWSYNPETGTFLMPDFTKVNSSVLEKGSKIVVVLSFNVSSKNTVNVPNQFSLISVHVFPGSLHLSSKNKPQTSINLDTANSPSSNAKHLMDLVDLNNPALISSGLVYSFKGTITNIEQDSDGSQQLAIDTQIPPIPNKYKWKSSNKFAIFKSDSGEKANASDLKPGSKVLITVVYTIDQIPDPQYPVKSNEFHIATVEILP